MPQFDKAKQRETEKIKDQKKESKPPYSKERLSHFLRKTWTLRSNPGVASCPSEQETRVSREMGMGH